MRFVGLWCNFSLIDRKLVEVLLTWCQLFFFPFFLNRDGFEHPRVNRRFKLVMLIGRICNSWLRFCANIQILNLWRFLIIFLLALIAKLFLGIRLALFFVYLGDEAFKLVLEGVSPVLLLESHLVWLRYHVGYFSISSFGSNIDRWIIIILLIYKRRPNIHKYFILNEAGVREVTEVLKMSALRSSVLAMLRHLVTINLSCLVEVIEVSLLFRPHALIQILTLHNSNNFVIEIHQIRI